MIRSVKVDNYKIHKNLKLDLENLTVLTGINSSGKSSVLQAFLLLRQSFMQGTLNEGLMLNGDLLSVGLGKDALSQMSDDDHISFKIHTEKGDFSWAWKADDLALNKDFLTLFGYPMDDTWKDCSLFTNKFQYISAARLEPSESYPLNTNMVESKKQLSQRYGKCELVAHYLHYYGVEKKLQVNNGLLHAEGEPTDLLSQVSAWEQVISPDVKVIPGKGEKNYSLKYAYQVNGDTTPAFTATNVGYGLSYALPIVVALLSAEPGSLILVENPEAHLHESAQSELGILIARAAQTGVQVVVETHSNHILNGILIASKRFENGLSGIDKNLVRIYYLKRHESGCCSDNEEIKIVGDGKIDHQPTGFFNRQDIDMAYLLGF